MVAKLGLQEYFLKDVPNILQLRCKKFLLRTHCSSNWTDLGGAKCQNDMMLLCAESSRKGTRIDLRTFLKVFTCCAKMVYFLLYAQTFRKLGEKKFETFVWYFFSTCCVRGVCFTCCVRGGENVEEGGREDGPDGEGPEPIRC